MQKGTASVGFREYIEVLSGTFAKALSKRRSVALRNEVSLLGYIKETEEVRGRIYGSER